MGLYDDITLFFNRMMTENVKPYPSGPEYVDQSTYDHRVKNGEDPKSMIVVVPLTAETHAALTIDPNHKPR